MRSKSKSITPANNKYDTDGESSKEGKNLLGKISEKKDQYNRKKFNLERAAQLSAVVHTHVDSIISTMGEIDYIFLFEVCLFLCKFV